MKRTFSVLRILLFLAVFLPSTMSGRQATAQTADCHLLIFADTSDPEIRESVQIDAAAMRNIFADNVPAAQLKARMRQDPNLSANQILSSIRSCPLRTGVDTLVVFYAGHGGFSSQRGHYLSPGGQTLHRSDLKRAMDSTGARLNVLITDACSVMFRVRAYRAGAPQEEPILRISPAFYSLYWQPSGFVDINSSSPGEVAVGDTLDGGYFTTSLCKYLSERSQRDLGWRELLADVSGRVDTRFREKHPSGVSRAVDGRTVRQSTQTVFSQLDLQAGSPAPPTAGLQITRIHHGTSATDLQTPSGQDIRLEPGDGLIAINGERLRDIAHFQEVVRQMPRGARFTLTILNKRDGQSLELVGRLDRGGGYRLGLHVASP